MKISWVDFAPTNDSVIDDTPLNNERQTFVQIMLPALGLFFFIAFVFYLLHGLTTYDKVNIRECAKN